jgi:hypothetical protein
VRYKGKLSTDTVEAVVETAKIAVANVQVAIEGLELSDMGRGCQRLPRHAVTTRRRAQRFGLRKGREFSHQRATRL